MDDLPQLGNIVLVSQVVLTDNCVYAPRSTYLMFPVPSSNDNLRVQRREKGELLRYIRYRPMPHTRSHPRSTFAALDLDDSEERGPQQPSDAGISLAWSHGVMDWQIAPSIALQTTCFPHGRGIYACVK